MKFAKKVFTYLHNEALSKFKTSEAYLGLSKAQPKISQDQLYGRGAFDEALPNLNQAICQETNTRITDENFIYKYYRQAVSHRYDENSVFSFGKTAEGYINAMAKYIGFASLDAFLEANSAMILAQVDSEIAPHAGFYEGFYLKTGQKASICTVLMQIEANGDVHLKTQVDDVIAVFEGRIQKLPHSKMLKISFISDPEVMSEDETYHFYYFLREKLFNDSEGSRLIGFYGGKGKRTFHPIAGKVRLYRTEADLQSYQPRLFPIHSPEYWALLAQKKSLMRFFLGKGKGETIRSETVRFFEDANIIERTFDNDSVQRIAGTYLLYHVASVGEAVSVLPLHILENGMIVMKSSFDPELVYKGVANTFSDDQVLALRIRTFDDGFNQEEREEKKLRLGIMIFYKTDFARKNINHLIGVYAMLGEKLDPIAGRVVLVKKEDASFDELVGKKIPIEDETALEQEYAGLSSYLANSLNNVIKVARTANEKFKHNSLYSELLYKAACYDADKGNSDDALKHMKLAFQYGFQDRNQLLQDREFGSLKKISDEDWQKVDAKKWKIYGI